MTTTQQGTFEVVRLNDTLNTIGLVAWSPPARGYVLVSHEQLEEVQLAVEELRQMLCTLAGLSRLEEPGWSICNAIAAISARDRGDGLSAFMAHTMRRHVDTEQERRRERERVERERLEREARRARGEDDGVPF